MEEIWKDIEGYEGYYQVSNLGRIKSLKRPRIMKSHLNEATGYIGQNLSNGQIKKYCLVHRLVAKAFIPNPENKNQINHKNGDKTDNNVTNLEWATQSENMKHSYKELNRPIRYDILKKDAKLTEDQVREIKEHLNNSVTHTKLAEMYCVSRQLITSINLGKAWKHIKI